MENKNNSGIFLGVIGVATLVVTIVGATFAYFAASVSSDAEAITAQSTNLTGTLGFTPTPDLRNNMIPVADDIVLESYKLTGANGGLDKCEGYSKAGGDTVYNLCSVYGFEIDNSATVAQTIYVSFKADKNEFTNLYYVLYRIDESGNATVAKESKIAPTTGNTDTDIISDLLAANTGKQKYELMLYIKEAGTANETDQAKEFTGTISASTGTGESNVTGTLTMVGA